MKVHNEEALQEFEALARDGGKPVPYGALPHGVPEPELGARGRTANGTKVEYIGDGVWMALPDFGEKRKFL